MKARVRRARDGMLGSGAGRSGQRLSIQPCSMASKDACSLRLAAVPLLSISWAVPATNPDRACDSRKWIFGKDNYR
jgi:hypothetical protein